MKWSQLRTAMAVTGLLLAAAGYGQAAGSLGGDAVAPAAETVQSRSPEADEVEAAITETDLVRKLESRLGADFAGAWFEPSTAQVRAGIVSPGAGAVVEEVASTVGMGDVVTTEPVRSTWGELLAAQERWDRRLWSLLEDGRVSTSISPERNSVEIELATSIGPARRAALEREASEDEIDVDLIATPYRHLGVVPQVLQCNKFQSGKAYCDPTIVGGVTIKGPTVNGDRNACTAGPAAIPKKRTSTTVATETYLLTAGHCINEKKNGGGVGGAWSAWNKGAQEKEIGKAFAYLNGETDVGVIDISSELSYWASAGKNNPVVPTIAPWKDLAEKDPYSVIDQVNPMTKTTSCLVGQVTGHSCGEIVSTTQTIEVNGVVTKPLVEVKGATQQKGDSGAPWVSATKLTADKPLGYVEGTHVGEKGETENPVFHSLAVSFAELKKAHGLDLELLTFFNENRHPNFKAGKYSAAVSGTDNSSAEEFTAFGSSVKCTERKFEGTLSEQTATLDLTPTYAGCTSGGVWPVTFANNGCAYRLRLEGVVATDHYNAAADIVCPEGKAGMELLIYSNHADKTAAKAMCTLTVPPQTGLETVTLTNSGSGVLVDGSALTGLDVKVKSTSCTCPGESAEAETTSGGLDVDGGLTLTATNMGEAVELEIGTE